MRLPTDTRPPRAALATALWLTGCAASTHHDAPGPASVAMCGEVEPAPTETEPRARVLRTDEVAALGDRITPPQPLSGPYPSYPDVAIKNRVQGTMMVTCRVMTSGRAVGCRVMKSLPFMDIRVIDALERRHYRPAMLDGKPVNIEWNFRLTFRLPQG